MTEASRPWADGSGDGYAYSDTQWQEVLNALAQHFGSGIAERYDDNLVVTPSSPAAKSVEVQSGGCWLDGVYYNNDAAETLVISDNTSGQPRIDLVVVQSVYASRQARLVVREGTPAATPVPPTPTQTAGVTWEEPLAEILVANSFTSLSGDEITNRSGAFRTFSQNLVRGYPAYVSDGAQPEEWTEEDGNITLTLEDATGESIEEIYDQVFKVVNGAAGGGKYISQEYLHASYPELFDDLTLFSARAFVYLVDAGTLTMSIYDQGATATLDTETTTHLETWVPLELSGVKIGTTGTEIRFSHSANSATFYVALIQANTGRFARNWTKPAVGWSYLRYREEQTAGTDGGTFTSGAWRTRVLNTESDDVDGIGAVAGNQITLPPGTYYVQAKAPVTFCDGHQLRIYDTTGTAELLLGQTSFAPAIDARKSNHAFLQGLFVIDVESVIELQHQCVTTRATDGLGSDANMGTTEVYAEIELWRKKNSWT